MKEMYSRAREAFEKALEMRPDYEPARQVVESIRRKLN
jgi:hypothetical protein